MAVSERKKLTEIARFTPDVPGLVRFYEKFLGMPPAWERSKDAEFRLGEVKLFLHATYAPEPGYPGPFDHIAFEVEDVDQACKDLRLEGLVVEIGPRDFDWGRSAYLRDPDGRWLELHQRFPEEDR